MAKITIVLTDTDLDKGQFSAEIQMEGTKLDDGFMTAAHLTGYYMMQQLNQEEFRAAVLACAERIVSESDGQASVRVNDNAEPDKVA